MNKRILCFIYLISILFVFVGCNNNNSIIVGTWSSKQLIGNNTIERMYYFNKDGTGNIPIIDGLSNIDITYHVVNDKIIISRGDVIDSFEGKTEYSFSLNNDTLTLISSYGVEEKLLRVSSYGKDDIGSYQTESRKKCPICNNYYSDYDNKHRITISNMCEKCYKSFSYVNEMQSAIDKLN